MVKVKRRRIFFYFASILGILAVTFICSFYVSYEKMYEGKIYPGVVIDNQTFGGKEAQEVENFYNDKNYSFKNTNIELTFDNKVATISAIELKAGYDSKLSATQGYLIGRSGNFLSDIVQKIRAKSGQIRLKSILAMDTSYIDETINYTGEIIDVPPQDALFNFENGKVKAFKLSKNGLKLNKEKTKEAVLKVIENIPKEYNNEPSVKKIALTVEIVEPANTTEKANNFGIKELIGVGKSTYKHSILSRVHNVALAASKINGKLVAPNTTFSFNEALGDVSAATGFQPAYIIKEGRTVLGDGGGVCQVSTTLFRAALNAGLPIEERHAHAYRVSYYEEDSPPGIDATVFAPSVDLKIKNDTPSHFLIQAEADSVNRTLVFHIYGTSDGRKAEMTKPVILSQTDPLPDVFQDDPTLPKDTIKQVDWKAWGAKVNFNYKVTRNGDTLIEKSYFSNYRPWASVFLKGTKV